MDKIKALLKILKGKKTTIGSLMVLIPAALTLLGQPEWAEWAQQAVDVLFGEGLKAMVGASGVGVMGVGLLGKAVRREW